VAAQRSFPSHSCRGDALQVSAATKAALVAAVLALRPAGLPRAIVVGPGTAIPTIGAALALARDGDSVIVEAGVYREPELVVRRRITLAGRGWPVLDGGGEHQVLTVMADSVAITGLVIRNTGATAGDDRAGIKVVDGQGCRVEDNRLEETFFGIYLSKASGCTIRHNRIRGQIRLEALAGNAIHSWSSHALLIEDNDVEGHRDGIYLEFTDSSVIRENRSRRNHRYGLHFMFSSGNRYLHNLFEGNATGVAVMYSNHITVTGNRFAGSRGGASYGLLCKDITDAVLEHNQFDGNSVGLQAEGTTRVVVRDNAFTANGWGVRVMADAVDTRFEGNRFDGNSFDVATNSVNSTSRFRGNYWDRYAGYDLDRDGIGDVPFAPVRLFALVVQQDQPALILQRSFFVTLLDMAERLAPVLTPQTMVDSLPLMRWGPR
jgi:nitrous oxidase accessory protein